jgi:hypothetical protein
MAAMLALCSAARCEENVLIDNFSKEVPGRWQTAMGTEWKINDGVFSSVPENGPYQKGMAVCDFPMVDGVIEAVVRSRTDRFGSVGIVGKYINNGKCWYVRFAYWAVELNVPGGESFVITPFLLCGNDEPEAVEKPITLKLVIKDGRVGLYVDGVLYCVFADPLAGEAGRPGLYTESSIFAQSFKARRTK